MRTTIWLLAVCTMLGCDNSQQSAERSLSTREQSALDHEPAAQAVSRVSPARHHITAGPKGEPPNELLEFVGPIELLAAGEYLDGGTTWVHLRDSDGFELEFCVTPNEAGDGQKPNTLLIGGTGIEVVSARRPLSNGEAKLVLDSLDQALEPILLEHPEYKKLERYDAAEVMLNEQYSLPSEKQRTGREWHAIFAYQAKCRLKKVSSFDLADSHEIAERTARLKAFDLAAESEKFRSLAGQRRSEQFDRMLPALSGALRHIESKEEMEVAIKRWLGEPDPNALAGFAGMGSLTNADSAPSRDDVYGYFLEQDGEGLVRVLSVDFRYRGVPAFNVMVSYGSPSKLHEEHDKITQEEKDIAASFGAIDINLGGGSLDDSYKPGFSLKLDPDRATKEEFEKLMQLTTLVDLSLSGENINDECLAWLNGHPYLASVTLQNTTISDRGLMQLRFLPSLKFVTIAGGETTPDGVKHFSDNFPQCKVDAR